MFTHSIARPWLFHYSPPPPSLMCMTMYLFTTTIRTQNTHHHISNKNWILTDSEVLSCCELKGRWISHWRSSRVERYSVYIFGLEHGLVLRAIRKILSCVLLRNVRTLLQPWCFRCYASPQRPAGAWHIQKHLLYSGWRLLYDFLDMIVVAGICLSNIFRVIKISLLSSVVHCKAVNQLFMNVLFNW